MKKRLLPILFLLPTLYSHAQVDNYCLRFSENGTVDCGTMPELDMMDNYTLQFWVNADEWTPGATLLSRGENLQVKLGASHCLEMTMGDQDFIVKSPKLERGKWMQLTMTVADRYLTILLNNEQIYRRRSHTGSYQLPTETKSFALGGNDFVGRIDEVRVWNTVLKPDFDYFINNTLNKWVPQLDHLVAYFKLDQNKCANIVDYVPYLKDDQTKNHHGVMSDNGVVREKVTDNETFKYRLCGSYTDNPRFFDWPIDKDKYLLTNDLIILGLQSYGDGHVKPENTNDHAKLIGEGAEYMESYKGRRGVLSLTGQQYLETSTDVLFPEDWRTYGYTFQTWINLDEWTEGAYLFKKLTQDGKGFSISLGPEKNHDVIVTVDGKKFIGRCKLTNGQWYHLAVSSREGKSSKETFSFFINGKEKSAFITDGSTNIRFTGVGQTMATIGEGLKAKLDETVIYNGSLQAQDIQKYSQQVPMPKIGTAGNGWLFQRASAFYDFDKADNIGWDYYSQDQWRDIMLGAYKGHRGYQVRISVRSHNGWQKTISDPKKRTIFAKDLAKCSEGYDGVELDLEWMDGRQTSLGQLSQEIRKYLPKEKTLMVSCHAYGAYKFPHEDMPVVDGFTFQQYGPQNNNYSLNNYTNSYNNFVNYGFSKDKIYLSYSSTTSGEYDANGNKKGWNAIGWISIADKYKASDDMGLRSLEHNGWYYYYQSPEQVYQRAKFAVDNRLLGIFYWDMGNDVPASSPVCLLRNCCYALNSNVDPEVTEVDINRPTAIETPSSPATALKPVYNAYNHQLTIEGGNAVASVIVYSMDGRQVAQGEGASLSLADIPLGSYIVKPILKYGGNSPRFVILKK